MTNSIALPPEQTLIPAFQTDIGILVDTYDASFENLSDCDNDDYMVTIDHYMRQSIASNRTSNRVSEKKISQSIISNRASEKKIEEFKIKANSVHGFIYDYSLINLTDKEHKGKVNIICKHHGAFWQRKENHLSGSGCPECFGVKKSTTPEFISKAIAIHGEKYDYSLSIYQNAITKVKIICPHHGIFERTPNAHLDIRKSSGCPSCSTKSSTQSFVSRASIIHNNKYDYSHVYYKHSRKKVKIICNIHGEFEQQPADHLNGQGCPGCALTGFDQTKPGYVYYLKMESECCSDIYKIGITNNKDISARLKTLQIKKHFSAKVLSKKYFEVGSDALYYESYLHKIFNDYRYYGEKIMANGNTELFTHDVLSFDCDISNQKTALVWPTKPCP